jgi:Tol biopolymer transport system component
MYALIKGAPLRSIVTLGLLALGAAGCGNSTDSAPLATRSSGPIAFLRAERTKPDPTTGIGPPHKLVVTDSEGGNERTILTPTGYDVESFTWSPDGRRLVFAALRPDDSQDAIFVANADGTGVRKIRPVPSNLSNPTWSPRGDLILFDEQDDAFSSVWVMKPDGSGARKLTPGYDFRPSGWSPDGGKIRYHGLVPSNEGVYLMNPDGSGKKRFSQGGGEWTPLGVAYWDAGGIGFLKPDGSPGKIEIQIGDEWQRYRFSPDGRTVALEGPIVPIGDWEIAIARIGEGKLQRLTDNDRQDVFPSFSPDGKSLAFEVVPIAKGADRPQRDIYVINADGSGERNLTDSSAADESSPAWAPKP